MSIDQTTLSTKQRSVRRWFLAVVFSAFFVGAAPLVGLAGTVLGMVQAFDTLGMSGGSDPGAMADAIGTALTSTATGLVISFAALVPLIITIIGLVRARRRLSAEGEQ